MVDGDRLFRMFTRVRGEITGSCSAEVEFDGDGEPIGVVVMKDGCVAWRESVADITFNYVDMCGEAAK